MRAITPLAHFSPTVILSYAKTSFPLKRTGRSSSRSKNDVKNENARQLLFWDTRWSETDKKKDWQALERWKVGSCVEGRGKKLREGSWGRKTQWEYQQHNFWLTGQQLSLSNKVQLLPWTPWGHCGQERRLYVYLSVSVTEGGRKKKSNVWPTVSHCAPRIISQMTHLLKVKTRENESLKLLGKF